MLETALIFLQANHSYNPHRDNPPSAEQMREDDAKAIESRNIANATKFKDTDFFAN